jgi:hypothetical protein
MNQNQQDMNYFSQLKINATCRLSLLGAIVMAMSSCNTFEVYSGEEPGFKVLEASAKHECHSSDIVGVWTDTIITVRSDLVLFSGKTDMGRVSTLIINGDNTIQFRESDMLVAFGQGDAGYRQKATTLKVNEAKYAWSYLGDGVWSSGNGTWKIRIAGDKLLINNGGTKRIFIKADNPTAVKEDKLRAKGRLVKTNMSFL